MIAAGTVHHGATGVIRADPADDCAWHWRGANVGLHRRGAALENGARRPSGPNEVTGPPGVLSMIHQTTVAATDSEIEDRSMRVVEWAMALIAAIAAGVLAFIR